MTSATGSPRRSPSSPSRSRRCSRGSGGGLRQLRRGPDRDAAPVEAGRDARSAACSWPGSSWTRAPTTSTSGPRPARLLQNQLRSVSKLQVLEPDRPPLRDALDRVGDPSPSPRGSDKQEREQYRLEGDRILQDADYWRKIGEEYQNPLIVTGQRGLRGAEPLGLPVRRAGRARSHDQHGAHGAGQPLSRAEGLHPHARSSTSSTARRARRCTRRSSPRKSSTARTRRSRRSPSYFELMDRLLPNFLGVISPQRIRGTRVLLR